MSGEVVCAGCQVTVSSRSLFLRDSRSLSLDPPFVDWWTLFGFNTGGGPCRAWCVGAGACRGSGWWVVGGLSTAGLSGVRQVLV